MISNPRGTVLIIAPHDDIHARVVAHEVEKSRGRCVLVDSAGFPSRWRLSFHVDGAESFTSLDVGDCIVDDRELCGVWIRRPSPSLIQPRPASGDVDAFCRAEARSALRGWLLTLGGRAMNSPASHDAASHKPFQLAAARLAGLRTPETMISNDPVRVERFTARRQTVFKTLTPGPTMLPTRVYDETARPHLPQLRLAPAIFQELIEGDDVRATIVDDAVFAVEIASHRDFARLDWRLDAAPEIRPHCLPGEIENQLRALLALLNLRYGAIDLKCTASGAYVFLEVNPGGQFLFAEVHGGQQISSAIARALLATRSSSNPMMRESSK